MNIILNGESIQIPQSCSLQQLIEMQGLAGKRLAAEVNRDIIPRAEHPTHQLQDGDRVEIVHAIGGGMY